MPLRQHEIDRLLPAYNAAEAIRQTDPTAVGLFDEIYLQLAEILANSAPPEDQIENEESLKTFFYGAAEVNAGTDGFFSNLVREYTARQLALRVPSFTGNVDALLQRASNAIASEVIGAVLGAPANTALPLMSEIATADAGGAATIVFDHSGMDPDDLALDEAVSVGWAGVPFFTLLGSPEYKRVHNAGNAELVDRLDDLKNVAFLFDSFRVAADSINASEAWTSTVLQAQIPCSAGNSWWRPVRA
jgi:hypothetical protein